MLIGLGSGRSTYPNDVNYGRYKSQNAHRSGRSTYPNDVNLEEDSSGFG